MAYQHTNSKGRKYYLHSKEVRLRSGRDQRIFFFAPDIREGAMDAVPGEYKVIENPRTGLPILKKK